MKTAFALFTFSALMLISLVLVSGTEVKPCVEKTSRCSFDATTVQICENGNWINRLKCGYGCENNQCRVTLAKNTFVNAAQTPAKPMCKENIQRCNIAGDVEQCENNRWALKQSCSYRCENAKCIEKKVVAETPTREKCAGCMLDEKCFGPGSQREANYCFNKEWKPLKLNTLETCKADFECSSKKCIGGKCTEKKKRKERPSIKRFANIAEVIKESIKRLNITRVNVTPGEEEPEVIDIIPPEFDSRSIKITPEGAIAGTVFTISAKGITDDIGVATVTATLTHESGENYTELMYDDGLHDDGEAGNGEYSGTWDSTDAPIGAYSVVVTVVDAGGNSVSGEALYTVAVIDQFPCLEVIQGHNNADELRSNVVFAFVNYNQSGDRNMSLEEFTREVVQLNNYSLFSREPFASNLDRFNLYYVDRIETVESYQTGFDHRASEASGLVQGLAASCIVPNKYVVGFVDWFFRSNAAFSSTAKVSIRNSTNEQEPINEVPKITTHEFGHLFGHLVDEYQEGGLDTATEGNSQCFYTSRVTCSEVEYAAGRTQIECNIPEESVNACRESSPWADLYGNGCGADGVVDCPSRGSREVAFDTSYNVEESCVNAGCLYGDNLIRHNFNNIMRFHALDPVSFGSHNERLICRRIAEDTGSSSGACSNLCLAGCAAGQQCIGGVCT